MADLQSTYSQGLREPCAYFLAALQLGKLAIEADLSFRKLRVKKSNDLTPTLVLFSGLASRPNLFTRILVLLFKDSATPSDQSIVFVPAPREQRAAPGARSRFDPLPNRLRDSRGVFFAGPFLTLFQNDMEKYFCLLGIEER
ncbi:MAG TPA: hypothetical protein DIS87_05975 [Armatimonadetes bacterium]|nr:hypothetical protein [Armatimonadota bacterium]